jgi:hypothetical protein
MKRLILIIAALAITSVAFAAGSYTLAPFDFGKVQLPKSNSGSYVFDTVTADQGWFLIIGSRVYKVDSAFFHKLAVDSIVSFSPLTILSTQINLGGGDVVVEQGRRMKIDTIFPANGKTVIGTVGDTAQFNSDLQKFTHKTLVDSLGLASAVDTIYFRISGDTVYIVSKKGSYFLNLTQSTTLFNYLRVYDQNNTTFTAALCSLYRADTNNINTNRAGLKIVIDSVAGFPSNHTGLSFGGTGISGSGDNYIWCNAGTYLTGGNTWYCETYRATTYRGNIYADNGSGLSLNNRTNNNIGVYWTPGYKGKFYIQSGKNVSANADSLFELRDSLGNTRFRVNNRGQITLLDTIHSDVQVNGLLKSKTIIVNFYDKDIQQYLYIPRNASINYEKPPISIAEPDSIIIDSVSFMAYYPPGTGADSNQIDSIWIKCDWSLVGEGSGGTVWSYGIDLIQSGSGFHKNTGLIKTSGTGKFHPTDRFIIYITGKKNENNTVEMTNLSAFCHYK